MMPQPMPPQEDPRGPFGCDRRGDPTCCHRLCWCCCGPCAIYNWDFDHSRKIQLYSTSFWVMVAATVCWWPHLVFNATNPYPADMNDLMAAIRRGAEADPTNQSAAQDAYNKYMDDHPDQYASVRSLLQRLNLVALIFGKYMDDHPDQYASVRSLLQRLNLVALIFVSNHRGGTVKKDWWS